MPYGTPTDSIFMTTTEVYDKAKAIRKKGFWFECEMLPDYSTVSFSITGMVDDEAQDIVTVLCQNGPEVCALVDKMILEFNW